LKNQIESQIENQKAQMRKMCVQIDRDEAQNSRAGVQIGGHASTAHGKKLSRPTKA
jgi:hypothetical protein